MDVAVGDRRDLDHLTKKIRGFWAVHDHQEILNLSFGHLASLGNCLEIKAISRSRLKKLYRHLLFSRLHLLELVCSCAIIKEYVLHALV